MEYPNLQDAILGELIWNDQIGYYCATVERDGATSLDVNLTDFEEDVTRIPLAAQAFSRIMVREDAIRLSGAQSLLGMYNNEWRDDEDDELTAQEFAEHITLEAIFIYGDLSAELYYNDGDLFAGHVVSVHLDQAQNVESTTIAG